MLKVVVFDKGLGGEAVADFLASELGTVEIIRAIDWRPQPRRKRSVIESCRDTEKQLDAYIDKVDLIVLGGYVTSLALKYLRVHHPMQKFIGMPTNFRRIDTKRCVSDQIVLLMNEQLVKPKVWRQIQKEMPTATLVLPDCSGWEYLIDLGQMTNEVLHAELDRYFTLAQPHRTSWSQRVRARLTLTPQFSTAMLASRVEDYGALESVATIEPDLVPRSYDDGPQLHPDAVVVLDTHFWEIEDGLREIFGYGVTVTDFRKELLHDVCLNLGLRGIDGKIDRY